MSDTRTLLTLESNADTLAGNTQTGFDFMNDEYALLAAEISKWPSKAELANIFKSDGYVVTEEKYSIVLKDFDDFVFRELVGDLGTGCITADHESAEELVAFSGRVSQTLAKAGVRHRFEVYSEREELVAYMHHDWPKDW